jgi:hypothetical protein
MVIAVGIGSARTLLPNFPSPPSSARQPDGSFPRHYVTMFLHEFITNQFRSPGFTNTLLLFFEELHNSYLTPNNISQTKLHVIGRASNAHGEKIDCEDAE